MAFKKGDEFKDQEGKKLKVVGVDKFNVCYTKEGKACRAHLPIKKFEALIKK